MCYAFGTKGLGKKTVSTNEGRKTWSNLQDLFEYINECDLHSLYPDLYALTKYVHIDNSNYLQPMQMHSRQWGTGTVPFVPQWLMSIWSISCSEMLSRSLWWSLDCNQLTCSSFCKSQRFATSEAVTYRLNNTFFTKCICKNSKVDIAISTFTLCFLYSQN